MRNPKRIKIILNKIEKVWNNYPDWRLGQLIFNLTGQYDSFHIEDGMLEEVLDNRIKENENK